MHVLFSLFLLLVAGAVTPASAADNLEAKKVRAMDAAEEITSMRSTLAKNFIKPDTDITEETFKSVCGAVGKRVKEIAQSEGFIIRHSSVRSRNPMNAAKPDEMEDLKMFERYRTLRDKWDTVEIEKKRYQRYQRSILVEEACLACHGPKDKRPRFIVEKYPDDKAYDFQVGDFRGVIIVLIKE